MASTSLTLPLPSRHLVRFPNRHLNVPRTTTFVVNCSEPSISISAATTITTNNNPPVAKKRKRFRKLYPGEAEGITQEMRFVAMRLRNVGGKYVLKKTAGGSGDSQTKAAEEEEEVEEGGGEVEGAEDGGGGMWKPSVEGFVKYLVDSKVVFETVERIVDESSDVAYAYFRRTGLERTERLSKDLEWFFGQGVALPQPGNPGISYSKYLEELAEKSATPFLSHFYNVYFSHIAGGRVIVSQNSSITALDVALASSFERLKGSFGSYPAVGLARRFWIIVSDKILDGRQLEFCKWDGDVEMLLKGVRENLNMLGEHWTRDERNKCLKEATKSFQYMGQIVRLIIL